jgi:hypothetical protein
MNHLYRGVTIDDSNFIMATYLSGKVLGVSYQLAEIHWYMGDLARTQLATEKNVLVARLSWS